MVELITSQSALDWAALFDAAAIKVALGLIFFMYVLDRPLRLIRRIREFGTFPFNRARGVNCNMMCALNGSIVLVLLVAVFETIISACELSAYMFQSEAPLLVAAAYTPLAFISGVVALALILAVYWRMTIRYNGQEDARRGLGERFSAVSSALKDRGVSNVEVFSLPILAIVSTFVPWIIPQIAV